MKCGARMRGLGGLGGGKGGDVSPRSTELWGGVCIDTCNIGVLEGGGGGGVH